MDWGGGTRGSPQRRRLGLGLTSNIGRSIAATSRRAYLERRDTRASFKARRSIRDPGDALAPFAKVPSYRPEARAGGPSHSRSGLGFPTTGRPSLSSQTSDARWAGLEHTRRRLLSVRDNPRADPSAAFPI